VPHQRCLFHQSKNLAEHLQSTAWVSHDPEGSLGLAGQLATWERMAPIVSGPPPCPTGAEE
jgi:hypothetical protein